MAAQVTVPTAAAGSPRRRASSERGEGSFGETESKSPGGGGGGAAGPGGAVRTARESWGPAGTRATEPAAGEARTGSVRGKRSPPTCCLRAAFCEVWATPAAAGAGRIERSLQNWRAAALQNCPPEK